MGKYKSKPIVIEAERWFPDKPHPKVKQSHYIGKPDFKWVIKDQNGDEKVLNADQGWIETLEGGFVVSSGDYIVKGTHGEYYPVKQHIFVHKYEKVED
ncbi:hypothetical protein BH753_gp150 [Bacillus phage Shbh1]|uniref:Uncharacterized protein n=1 Tax=Bacillus phage Shbh1 TaxID=1796992 RepID=A0A142F1H5_9CAUD|nr:hypothetical protein BH753_gp150 [Bacillus phage Shbh1]AMQ66632.1 hypothetical protein [Bacillus phage Shbh1]